MLGASWEWNGVISEFEYGIRSPFVAISWRMRPTCMILVLSRAGVDADADVGC